MKTITMYELLGLIKNGKAPKRIKYINSIWEYNKETKDYLHDDLWLIYSMNSIGLTEREVEIIEDTPTLKELFQQEINNENEILSSRLESDTKLDIIKNYITSEEAIDNFKTIESRDEWLKVHDFILDIIDNYKLQNENGEVIEDTPKEDKKIEKPILDTDNDVNGSYDIVIIDDIKYEISKKEKYILGKIGEIIDYITKGEENE